MSNTTLTGSQTYKLILGGLLCIWTISIFLPGSYSIDSWNQWKEITSGHYDDWYGTALVTTWKWLWKFTGNYMCLYIFQMTVYWTFVTMLLWDLPFKSAGYWICIAFAWFFGVFAQYVMRDVLTVLAWGLALAVLLRAVRSSTHRRSLTILSMLLLAYGLWVRINTLAGLMPLAYIGLLLLGGERLAFWKRALITVFSCLFLLFCVQVWTYKIQKANHAYPEYKLKLLDLSGISKLCGKNMFPPEFAGFPGFRFDTLMAEYTPAGIDDIYWPDNGRAMWPYPNDSLNRLVSHAWIKAVSRHPVYYLENRLEGYLYYLHIRRRFKTGLYWNVVAFWIQPDGPLPAKLEWTPFKDLLSKMYGFFDRTPLYDPWFWLLLNTLGFALFIRRYLKKPKAERLFWLTHACIQLSGILFILSQALIYQHDRDFRYTYWNVYAGLFALAGLFTKSREAGVSPAS